MYVKQRLSILFYPRNVKINGDNTVPIYVRVTIDGFWEEFSSGVRIEHGSWDVADLLNVYSSSSESGKNVLISTSLPIQ